MRKYLLSLALLLAGATSASAQWSENPATNNRVTPSNVAFYDPVMLTNAQGVSYFFTVVPAQLSDGRDAFQYRMQILNPQGQRVYGAAGKVLTHEPNITWTKFNDYITLDRDGNCIFASYDLRSATGGYEFNYFIYKVAPTGEVLWGPVPLNGGQADASMLGLTMCATDDGGSAFAYTMTNAARTHSVTHLERLDANGQPLWAEPLVIEPSHTTTRPLLVNNGRNEVMLLYQDGDQYDARAIDANGADVWPLPVMAYGGGFSSDRVYPSINVQQGAGGGIIFSVMNGGWDGRFVCLDADGDYIADTDYYGTRVTLDDVQTTVPSLCYDPQQEAYYAAFATMGYYGYEGYGVSVQKFSADGERLWGDGGVALVPLATGQQTANVQVRLAGNGRIAVFWQYMGSTAYNDPVATYMAVLDSEGNMVVEPQNFTTSANSKSDLMVSPLLDGNHFIASWTEKRSPSTSACIYAQYVNIDGSTTNGIETVDGTALQPTDRCYDLQGRPLLGTRPAAGQLVIVRQNGTVKKLLTR